MSTRPNIAGRFNLLKRLLKPWRVSTLHISFLLLIISSCPEAAAATCPDLSTYYPGSDPDWAELQQQLAALMPVCLEDSEYFALYGAAQLNNSRLAGALEALERALLLNPDSGAARIDYAQALFEEGQLFTALEMNAQVLQREDLPIGMQAILQTRQTNWQARTRQTSFQADVLAGYDDNLNGAPDPDHITLTLSGDPILLPLSPDFQAVSGPYISGRLAARHRQATAELQHNWFADLRTRVSEHTASDILQFSSRYNLLRPGRNQAWQGGVGISHINYGGGSLFTGTDASARYQLSSRFRCKPFYSLAVQHQLFHQESQLNALESKAGAGLSCPMLGTQGSQVVGIELGLLRNNGLRSGRVGGDREGWQFNLDWQRGLFRGIFRAQLNYTQLNDRQGYSPLLSNGAERWLERGFALLQYREPLPLFGVNSSLLVNVYHQRQKSNIELFKTTDTTAEIGISWGF